jgi:hypothetical protein
MSDQTVTVEAGAPLLDRGTLPNQIPGQSVENWSWLVTAWPSCGEASIVLTRTGPPSDFLPAEVEWDNVGRSVRRSRSTLRRYLVHNGLGYMPTLTFRYAPATVSGLNAAVKGFQRRLVRAGVDEANLWVPERGEKRGRLHVHMAVAWWADRGAVEVCDRCAVPGLRKVRSDIPQAGSFCIGCMWGHGFVGAPSEAVGDPRGLAVYVSKYAAKDLGLADRRKGSNRYHPRVGFQPANVQWASSSMRRARRRLHELVGQELEVVALHEVVEEWEAPPTFVANWAVA